MANTLQQEVELLLQDLKDWNRMTREATEQESALTLALMAQAKTEHVEHGGQTFCPKTRHYLETGWIGHKDDKGDAFCKGCGKELLNT